MQLDLIRRVQVEFAAMEAMLDVGECIDAEDGEAFEDAFAELVETRPESLEEASAMLRVLAFVGARYGDDRAMAMQLCAGMMHVAAGLALAATARRT